jgi:hypothetical protein
LSPVAAVLLILIVLALLIPAVRWAARFVAFCLTDLAQTPDEELRHFTRRGWAMIILVMLPLGGMLYLTYGKAR